MGDIYDGLIHSSRRKGGGKETLSSQYIEKCSHTIFLVCIALPCI